MGKSPEPDALTKRVMTIMKELRLKRRWTGEALANEMCHQGYPITRGIIANYENGRRELITITEAAGFAKLFQINLTWLITGKGAMCEVCQDHIWANMTCNVCGRSGPDSWEDIPPSNFLTLDEVKAQIKEES